MLGNPTGAMGLTDYLGKGWRSRCELPVINVPGCPVKPDNMMETLLAVLFHMAGLTETISLDQLGRPTWLFNTLAREGCTRTGFNEHADFAATFNSRKCLAKRGRWGSVVNCNVSKRGWMGGIGGCPSVGGICIGCTMPGFPDRFMPFMDTPMGGQRVSELDAPAGAASARRADDRQRGGEHRADLAEAGHHMTANGTSGSGASIAAIDAAALEARQRGHNLAGFRRLCNSAGYQFCARCRGCGQEVSVHRGTGSTWWHHPHRPLPAQRRRPRQRRGWPG